MTTKLTDGAVERLPFSEKQYTVADATPGLFLVIGPASKTWTARASGPDPKTGKSRQHKKALGHFPEISVKTARELAGEWAKTIRQGTAQRSETTLAEGWENYRRWLVANGRSVATIRGYEYGMKLLEDFHGATLRHLSDNRRLIHERALEVLEEIGQGAQNSLIQTLKVIYNFELARDTSLPPIPPTFGLKVITLERDRAMGGHELADWLAQLEANVSSPVKRAFWWFQLLSGARTGALRRAKWEHIDRKRRVLTIPEDKNGGYDLPLSREMIRALVRAARAGRALNPLAASTFIFPRDPQQTSADDFMGHPEPPGIRQDEKRAKLAYYNHDLRHSWRGFADDAGLSEADKDALGNWKPKGQGGRYTNISKRKADRLRELQEQVTAEILSHLPKDRPGKPLTPKQKAAPAGQSGSAEIVPFTNVKRRATV
ncbi:integrase family protein [Tabrizicola thermarum]|uniref:integrase family protein n=1 Tax=Tabrizicola thermarum TaxID=2670345 RepID=UPI000FFB7774|nr:integrase family protein [Tabrizicola thermarum]